MELTFIELENFQVDRKKKMLPNACYVKKRFIVSEKPNKATLFMTALGVYEAYINGKCVGEQVLAPGFTNYNHRLQYQEYDITDLIAANENEIHIIVGNGWYRGNVGAFNKRYAFGEKLALAAKLVICYHDGKSEVIETDQTWQAASDGALCENDLKVCERYDARKVPVKWHNCTSFDYAGKLVKERGERLCEHERFTPQVLKTPDGNTILDFGQNIAGFIKFRITGDAGTEVSLQMGETLDEQGNFTLKNLQGDGKNEMLLVNQKLTYILKEGEQVYRAKFLLCGFRYVLLSEWPETVTPENFEAVAVYSDLAYKGDFFCSNEKINQLVHNVRWAMKSNFVDIPTDCPHRERAGWAGDVNVFLETADYLADTRKFIGKWMEDFIDAQEPDGALPYIIPEIPAIGSGKSSAGWSDAISTIPIMQYKFYGDDAEIRKAYETVKRFVEYNRKRAQKRHLFHFLKRGQHYKYILDTGFHYGEWLEPGSSNIKDALTAIIKPDAEVATAWFYFTTKNLVKMAHILGRPDDEREYQKLAANIREAYQKEFIPDSLKSGRQCRYVRPLYMGLVSGKKAENMAKKLNDLVKNNRYKIGTGFLTTYQILNVLTDYGYADSAYKMMEQEECPGWLYEIKKGATTTWEGWDAIDENGNLKSLSQNHFSQGAAVSWLFSRCAGIQPLTPGFRKLLIHPAPGGNLKYATARYKSIYGIIESSWKISDRKLCLKVVIRSQISAKIIMPDGNEILNAVSGEYSCEMKHDKV